MQFKQLVKLFKIRAVAKLVDEMPNEDTYRYLIPPNIFTKLMMLQESPSNNQDQSKKLTEFLTGQISLDIYCVTWNQARTP